MAEKAKVGSALSHVSSENTLNDRHQSMQELKPLHIDNNKVIDRNIFYQHASRQSNENLQN